MTRILALLVALSAIFGCGGSGPASPAPSPTPAASVPPPTLTAADGWVLLAGSPTAPSQNRHDDVFFLSDSLGWLVNVPGEVYRTQDGGTRWERMGSPVGAMGPRCVGFVSAEHGFIGNLNTTGGPPRPDEALWETVDGGASWRNISTRIAGAPVAGLCGMRVLSSSTVYAVGRWARPAVFVKTTDRGATWRSIDLGEWVTGVIDLHFFNERSGFVVGGAGVGLAEAEQRGSRTVILETSDGGETWTPRYVSEGVGQWAWKIDFVDDRVGYVTAEGPNPDGAVLKTTDGGRTWTPRLVAAGRSFQAVGFVSPDRGWVGSDTLWATTDGGTTWRNLGLGTHVNRIRVLHLDRAFAVGTRAYRWTP